ncbi:MAG: polysaccharide biosynthesis C-terminal domain-containing protein [Microthrixaceae bacterium]
MGTVLLLVGGVFIGAWFFGGDVIRNWMGDGYGYSHQILLVLLAAQMVALPCNVVRSFLFGMGDVRFPAILYLAEAVLNLGISIVLCSQWGLIGVAWGTFIPVVIIELGVLLPMAIRRMGIPAWRLWTQAIGPQVLPLAALASYCVTLSAYEWSHAGWPTLITVTACRRRCVGHHLVGPTGGERIPACNSPSPAVPSHDGAIGSCAITSPAIAAGRRRTNRRGLGHGLEERFDVINDRRNQFSHGQGTQRHGGRQSRTAINLHRGIHRFRHTVGEEEHGVVWVPTVPPPAGKPAWMTPPAACRTLLAPPQ